VITKRLSLQAATAVLTVILGIVASQLTTLLPQPRVEVLIPETLLAVAAATVVAESLARIAPESRHDTIASTVLHRRWHRVFGIELRPRILVALLAGLLVGTGSGAAIALVRRSPQPLPPPALTVDSVRLAVDPPVAEGHCPSAGFTFQGAIRTNGAAGAIAFVWVQPDGLTTPTRSVSVEAGTTVVRQSLRFTFAGQSPATGSARLRVIRPLEVSSTSVTVRFVCP
jgi:hypothetical protein